MTSYRYLGNWPDNRKTDWSDRLQGVGHNDEHWIFTQMTRIMKFHVSTDLSKAKLQDCTSITPIPAELKNRGYNHFCDPEYVRADSGNTGYLFLPIENDEVSGAELCVFIDDNDGGPFRFVGNMKIDQKTGWCAISPSGSTMYTSAAIIQKSAPFIRRHSIKWDFIRDRKIDEALVPEPELHLIDFDGGPMHFGGWLQGGVCYPNGDLALLAGRIRHPTTHQGIAVFDVKTGKIKDRSTQKGNEFRFAFRPKKGVSGEEGEGITYWDTTKIQSRTPHDHRNPRHPSLNGQLHAILLNKRIGDDKLWFKHWELNPVPVRGPERREPVADPGQLMLARGAESLAEIENPTPPRRAASSRIRRIVAAVRRR